MGETLDDVIKTLGSGPEGIQKAAQEGLDMGLYDAEKVVKEAHGHLDGLFRGIGGLGEQLGGLGGHLGLGNVMGVIGMGRGVVVKVSRGHGLPKMDMIGSVDAFCSVTLWGWEHKTRVCKGTFDPVWEEEFTFRGGEGGEVVVAVWDHDIGR